MLATLGWGCGANSAPFGDAGPADGRPDAGSFDAGGRDAGGSNGADAGPPDPFQLALLTAHNAVRASAQPAPSPALPTLGWSDAAAARATAWAENCQFEHNPAGGYGENLYAATNAQTPVEVVSSWAQERADYSYAANSCAANRQCGHYTQLVWRSTTAVGCATKMCNAHSPFSSTTTWYLWVCDYAPPGNFVGERPY